ncbi:FAD-binding oxidoreductase [Pinisolibacter aquiterrae]|jgi:D-lactate dehydrogenase (cytochrome)|uniref:FAD-binding oxidoreductase n=1 Tax=Pinisolibacter aquiterrae TaxID=2815579 RepID=UPI001C3E1643|nr:FAD-linked oxidase C-terminal domain-containing protein [Pinisolibacter aquiterrae]MBV5265101.1 FAD-binding protein [Pinisolibacter aquiterrae]MCC8235569.1 FAD-binding protein [Pinisolibacter aquiterrae]
MSERTRNEAGIAATIERLIERFGERVSTSASMREQHGHTLTWIANQAPDAVVFAKSEAEVQEIVRIAAANDCPLVPFGAGTSLEGHLNAPYGGISVDVSAMDAIVAVHPDDLDVVVQPGIRRKALNEQLRDTGLFFPIDPGADATLGGMAATRASGTNAVRYGTMKDNVLALRAVTATGEVVTTSRRAKKSSTGYDLTRLFVGSEGTLGIITELTIRLSGIPEAISGGICPFPSVQAAADAVILTIQSGIPVARIELLDEVQVRACNLYSKLDLPETPLLLVEFHGTEAWVAEQSTRFGEIAEDLGGGPFTWTTKPEERSKLWAARHDAYWAGLALRPGCQTFSSDVCVPISRLAECIAETKADIEATGLVAPIVGHVGDGNFHTLPLFDPADADEVARVKAFVGRLVERTLAMEGTASGEHGVGQGKMKYLEAEHGAAALDMMATIKRALDPKGILNPGKIVAIR